MGLAARIGRNADWLLGKRFQTRARCGSRRGIERAVAAGRARTRHLHHAIAPRQRRIAGSLRRRGPRPRRARGPSGSGYASRPPRHPRRCSNRAAGPSHAESPW